MALREICLLGEAVLKTPAEEVTEFDADLESLVEDMWTTMYHADGIGLAGPQIGVSRRILVIDVRGSDENAPGPMALVNPTVIESSRETDRAVEGCLSIPGMEEVVERPERVRVRAQTTQGEVLEVEADGLFARALQHEIDHLDGILFIDRISPLKRRLLLKKWRKARAEVG